MQYVYIPASNSHGRVTVCIDKIDDGGPTIHYFAGITYCSPKDQFVKSVGKQKAAGRLRQGIHEGVLKLRPNSKHFFSAKVNAYTDTYEVAFAKLLAAHIESFVPAAVAKEATSTSSVTEVA